MGRSSVPPISIPSSPSKQPTSKEPSRGKTTVTLSGTPPPPPSINLPTAQEGIMVPYILGTYQITSPNILWYGNLKPKRVQVTEDGGTEEIVDSNGNITEKTTVIKYSKTVGYSIDIQIGLCLGPGVHLKRIIEEGVTIWAGDIGPERATIAPTAFNSAFIKGEIVFFGGNFDQPRETHLVTAVADTPAYVGISYILLKDVDITEGLGNLQFEVSRFPNPIELNPEFMEVGDEGDINCAAALADVITNDWGGAGIDKGLLDIPSFLATAITLHGENNGMSLYNQQEAPALSLMAPILDQMGAYLFQRPSNGKLYLRLNRDADADAVVAPVFGRSDIRSTRSLSKPASSATASQVRATFTSRVGAYSTGVVAAQSIPASPSGAKARQTVTLDYPCVMNATLAQNLLARDMADYTLPLLIGRNFDMSRAAADLLPGDYFVINHPKYGLVGEKFRVAKKRDLPGDGGIIVEADHIFRQTVGAIFAPEEEYESETFPTPRAPLQVKVVNDRHAFNRDMGPVNTGVSSQMIRQGYPAFLVRAHSDAQPGWRGFMTNAPRDLSTGGFRTFPSVYPLNNNPKSGEYATFGKLSSAMSKYAGFETGFLGDVVVANVERMQQLIDIYDQIDSGLSPDSQQSGRAQYMFIDDEIFFIEGVTRNSSTTMTLHGVRRAILDSVYQAHAANADVWIGIPSPVYPNWPDALTDPALTIQYAIFGWRQGYKRDIYSADQRTGSFNLIPNGSRRLVRPHDTRIGGLRPTSPLALLLQRGGSIDVTWKPRYSGQALGKTTSYDPLSDSQKATRVLFQDDTTQAYPDVMLKTVSGSPATLVTYLTAFEVVLRDSAGTSFVLGSTTGNRGDGLGTSLTGLTIPMGAAFGDAVIFVRGKPAPDASFPNASFYNTLYHDEIPVGIVSSVEATTDVDTIVITTDGAAIMVKE